MEIVLYQPKIPQNTGNIIRTCRVTNTKLTLVGPLGFSLSDKLMRRAGLDYYKDMNIQIIDDLESYLEGKQAYFFSSKTKRRYTDVQYSKDSILVFGSETDGLPLNLYQEKESQLVTIPMVEGSRCLNLSNSVNIGVYEALRQLDFSFTE